jgi:hypothetical protein
MAAVSWGESWQLRRPNWSKLANKRQRIETNCPHIGWAELDIGREGPELRRTNRTDGKSIVQSICKELLLNGKRLLLKYNLDNQLCDIFKPTTILVKTNPKERKKLYLNTLNPTGLGWMVLWGLGQQTMETKVSFGVGISTTDKQNQSRFGSVIIP